MYFRVLRNRLQFYFKFTFIEQKDISEMNRRIDRRIAVCTKCLFLDTWQCCGICTWDSVATVRFAVSRDTDASSTGRLIHRRHRWHPYDTPTAPRRHPDGTPPTLTQVYSISVAQALHPPPLLALLVPLWRRRDASRHLISRKGEKSRERKKSRVFAMRVFYGVARNAISRSRRQTAMIHRHDCSHGEKIKPENGIWPRFMISVQQFSATPTSTNHCGVLFRVHVENRSE